MKINLLELLFAHRREDGKVYAYKDKCSYECNDELVVEQTAACTLPGRNDYSHRYPVVRLQDNYYAAYRGTNKLYELDRLRLIEVSQLSNIFPYAAVPVAGKYLLVTDCKGKAYYKLHASRLIFFKPRIPAGSGLTDVFLHAYAGRIYFINRNSADFYTYDDQREAVCPIDALQLHDSGYNQISFIIDQFVLIGKEDSYHTLVDLKNLKTFHSRRWCKELEANLIKKHLAAVFTDDGLLQLEVGAGIFRLVSKECCEYYGVGMELEPKEPRTHNSRAASPAVEHGTVDREVQTESGADDAEGGDIDAIKRLLLQQFDSMRREVLGQFEEQKQLIQQLKTEIDLLRGEGQ